MSQVHLLAGDVIGAIAGASPGTRSFYPDRAVSLLLGRETSTRREARDQTFLFLLWAWFPQLWPMLGHHAAQANQRPLLVGDRDTGNRAQERLAKDFGPKAAAWHAVPLRILDAAVATPDPQLARSIALGEFYFMAVHLDPRLLTREVLKALFAKDFLNRGPAFWGKREETAPGPRESQTGVIIQSASETCMLQYLLWSHWQVQAIPALAEAPPNLYDDEDDGTPFLGWRSPRLFSQLLELSWSPWEPILNGIRVPLIRYLLTVDRLKSEPGRSRPSDKRFRPFDCPLEDLSKPVTRLVTEQRQELAKLAFTDRQKAMIEAVLPARASR